MEKELSIISVILNFLSSLIWPGVFVWLILKFKPQFEHLLNRMISAKIAGNEVVFQSPSPDSAPANPEAKVEISQIDPNGFFTADGIREIVSQSGLLPVGEKAISQLLLFDNGSQHTWLVGSRSQIAIVLDDEDTRANNRLTQRVMDKKKILPLNFGPRGYSVGFGSYKGRWYYSQSLFPTTEMLDKGIEGLMNSTA